MHDEQWLEKLRSQLQGRDAELTPAVEQRLRQARHRALAACRDTDRKTYRAGWLAIPALAMTVMLAFGVLHWTLPPTQPETLGIIPTDLELIFNSTQFGLLEELEFYQWLEAQEPHAG